MKRYILLLLSALLMSLAATLEARPVDKAAAASLAERILNKTVVDATPARFTGCHLFTGTDGKGFVLIAADDRVRPVLAYSPDGTFDPAAMPGHVAAWIEGYQQEIASVAAANASPSRKVAEEWRRWNNGTPKTRNTSVEPLLTSRWYQAAPYNSCCPYDTAYDARGVTGCVATAMAQIMRYWQWPEVGYSSRSYPCSYYGTLTAVFDTTHYRWSLMPDTLGAGSDSAEIDAVATLMYHAGVAVETMYHPEGSGSYTLSTGGLDFPSADNALKTYFRYNPMLKALNKGGYNDAEWDAMVRAELDAGRPVFYTAVDPVVGGGHAFILDGYDTLGMFHVNWGWGGRYDAWYLIDSLAPGAGSLGGEAHYAFTSNASAIFGLYPAPMPTGEPSVVSLVSNDPTLGSVTGSGTYQTYDTVNVEVTAAEGCRYLAMASGNRNVPFGFLALGQNYTDTAIFERITGDTIGYSYDYSSDQFPYDISGTIEWGMRIPASMRQSKSLSAVQLYYCTEGNHTLNIYEGATPDGATPVYTKTYYLDGSRGWRTLELDSLLSFAPGQTVWVTFSFDDPTGYAMPISSTSYCGNPDGSWYRFGESASDWDIYQFRGGRYTWMLRAVLDGTVGINEVLEDNIRIFSRDGRIVAEGSTDEVQVFDMAGRLIRNEALPTGVYLVKIGNRTARKVMVIRH